MNKGFILCVTLGLLGLALTPQIMAQASVNQPVAGIPVGGWTDPSKNWPVQLQKFRDALTVLTKPAEEAVTTLGQPTWTDPVPRYQTARWHYQTGTEADLVLLLSLKEQKVIGFCHYFPSLDPNQAIRADNIWSKFLGSGSVQETRVYVATEPGSGLKSRHLHSLNQKQVEWDVLLIYQRQGYLLTVNGYSFTPPLLVERTVDLATSKMKESYRPNPDFTFANVMMDRVVAMPEAGLGYINSAFELPNPIADAKVAPWWQKVR